MASNREAYQIPTSGSQTANTGAGAPPAARTNVFDSMDAANASGATMHYICGDCGTKFPLKRNDPIRCKECGCRVLYKERTKRYYLSFCHLRVPLPACVVSARGWLVKRFRRDKQDGPVRGSLELDVIETSPAKMSAGAWIERTDGTSDRTRDHRHSDEGEWADVDVWVERSYVDKVYSFRDWVEIMPVIPE
ncbi:DNA directed RNA polymerase [Hypoxylon sp. FL0890]|nr:DNA directed RNA polymerase [Hypoxylon sp. FL0890]